MEFETLVYAVDDGIARITLDREKAANAIDLQMAKDLMRAAIECDTDAGVRAVVIGSRGKMFCAGGDLASFSGVGDRLPALLKEVTSHLHAAISRFARMRAPVIASVGGAAAGAGFSLVCAADLAICSESAKFTLAYTQVGLTPDGSSTYFLPRIVGQRRALELMLTNRLLTANDALEWGIVNQVVPDTELAAATEELARRMADGATTAFGATKRLLQASGAGSLESQMELESRAIAEAAAGDEAQEGMKAFFAKRPADFRGRA